MAWERAKGELNAMLATYWPQQGESGEAAREDMTERLRDFISEV